MRKVYAAYALTVFILVFFMLLPAMLILMAIDSRHHFIYTLNRWWARIFFFMICMPVHRQFEFPVDPSKRYIFCANHFSYLDIPAMGLAPVPAVFVGKSSLVRIPLFGMMFKRVHITVDRTKLKSRYEAFTRSVEVLKKGLSLLVFPEGGILAKHPPAMGRLKDGAFRAAIAEQIPVIPVTIPYNWIILPDRGEFKLYWHKMEIIFHQPIETTGLTSADVSMLKSKVFAVIDESIKIKNNENRPKYAS